MDTREVYERVRRYGLIIDAATVKLRVMEHYPPWAARVVLGALLKGDITTKQRIFARMQADHFREAYFRLIFEGISEQSDWSAEVDIVRLYNTMEAHVRSQYPAEHSPAGVPNCTADEAMPGYFAVIDHIVALEIPDQETVDAAMALLERIRAARLSQTAASASDGLSTGSDR